MLYINSTTKIGFLNHNISGKVEFCFLCFLEKQYHVYLQKNHGVPMHKESTVEKCITLFLRSRGT